MILIITLMMIIIILHVVASHHACAHVYVCLQFLIRYTFLPTINLLKLFPRIGKRTEPTYVEACDLLDKLEADTVKLMEVASAKIKDPGHESMA